MKTSNVYTLEKPFINCPDNTLFSVTYFYNDLSKAILIFLSSFFCPLPSAASASAGRMRPVYPCLFLS